MSMETAKTEVLEYIKNKVRESLDQDVMRGDPAEAKKAIEDVTQKTLVDLSNTKVIGDHHVQASILWDTWTTWMKIQWFFLRYLGFGNRYRRRNEEVIKLITGVIHLVMEAVDVPYDSYVGHDIHEMEKTVTDVFKRWWFERNPKSIMVANVYVNLIQPVEHINIDFVIKSEGTYEVKDENDNT